MMDELAIRRRRALVQALEQPLFDQAIDDLRRRLADEIADCMDPAKAEALRAERFALSRVRNRLQAYINDLQMEKLNAA